MNTHPSSQTLLGSDATAPTPSHWPPFWIACSATFLVSLDTTMLFAAFDALRHSFASKSAAELSWVLNAYTVVFAAMLIPSGGLSDAYGRKRIFRWGLAVTPGPLLVMLTALLTGKLASRVGHRRFLLGGSLLYAASSLWFLGVPGSEPNYVLDWLPGLVMSGIAVGLVLPSLSAAAVSRLPAAHYAVGSAVNQATVFMNNSL